MRATTVGVFSLLCLLSARQGKAMDRQPYPVAVQEAVDWLDQDSSSELTELTELRSGQDFGRQDFGRQDFARRRQDFAHFENFEDFAKSPKKVAKQHAIMHLISKTLVALASYDMEKSVTVYLEPKLLRKDTGVELDFNTHFEIGETSYANDFHKGGLASKMFHLTCEMEQFYSQTLKELNDYVRMHRGADFPEQLRRFKYTFKSKLTESRASKHPSKATAAIFGSTLFCLCTVIIMLWSFLHCRRVSQHRGTDLK